MERGFSMKRLLAIGSLTGLALMLAACEQKPVTTETSQPETAVVQTEPADHPGLAPYLGHCAECHDRVVYKAPNRQFLGMMAPDAILAAMDGGVMATHAEELDSAQRRAVSEFLTGRSLDDLAVAHPPPRCEQNELDNAYPPAALGWGIDHSNSRFQPARVAGLTVDQLSSLSLKWAFAYPNAIQARSQPTVAGGAVFVGSHDGTVYSLDGETGCLRWSFRASAEVRTGIIVSDWVADDETATPQVYFGDILARAYSLDARTGKLNWMTKVDEHPNATITGTPALVGDRLFVPVSSLEVVMAIDPQYACCTFRGSLVSLDVANGETVWKSFTIDAEPVEVARTRVDTAILAPSGAPIWNSPTVDEKRGRLYLGTGENYSSPAGGTSDAIIAFEMSSGEKIWVSQQTEGDAWNVGCLSDYTTDDANCPEENGPDYDFAASPILVTLEDGQDVLVAGQKSGAVMGIDPDTGETLWRTQVGRGGVQGGIHFGMAAEGSTVYVPISDQSYPEDATRYKYTSPPRPGMYAVNANNGEILWSTPANDVCADRQYCDPGISQAVTAVPGAVIAGHMDGRLRIYSRADGTVIWEMDTLREFETVSGEQAHGGSFGGGGPMVANGVIYVNSGYGMYFHMPGNVLLALAPKEG
jgi:polyvinyl alcohol dehydrogenase (cytochrome)